MLAMSQCFAGLLAFTRKPRVSKTTGLTQGVCEPVRHGRNVDEDKPAFAVDAPLKFGEGLFHLELRRQFLEKILLETSYVEASGVQYESGDEEIMFQIMGEDNVCPIFGDCINGVCFTLNGSPVHFGCREQFVEKIRLAKYHLTLIPELRSLRRYIKRCRWQAQKEEWEATRHRRKKRNIVRMRTPVAVPARQAQTCDRTNVNDC